jgi:hypothetical protein
MYMTIFMYGAYVNVNSRICVHIYILASYIHIMFKFIHIIYFYRPGSPHKTSNTGSSHPFFPTTNNELSPGPGIYQKVGLFSKSESFPTIRNNRDEIVIENLNKPNVYGNLLSRPFSASSSKNEKNPRIRPHTANSHRSDKNLLQPNTFMMIIPPPIKKEYVNQETNTDINNDDISLENGDDIAFNAINTSSSQTNKSSNHIMQFRFRPPQRTEKSNLSEKINNENILNKNQDFIQILKNSKNPLLDLYQVFMYIYRYI